MSELQRIAAERVDAQDFIGARPYLEELVKRFEGEKEEQRKVLEGVYFYLGVGYLVEYGNSPSNDKLSRAIEWFLRLNKEFPNGNFAVMTNLALADAYRGLQEWENAANVYKTLLTPPLELRLNSEQREEALKKISQAYYIKQDWAAGEPWFRKFLAESTTQDNQAMAAAALMEAAINQNKFNQVIELFPYLVGESPARYGLQLNVALIAAGDKLANEKRYGEAMLMYRMVLTVEQILTWQKARLANLEGQFNLLKATTGGESERGLELDAEIFNTKEQIKALEAMTSYTPELRVRIARNYLLTGRDWESFWAYKELIKDYPNHANIEDFIYAAFTGATNIGLTDEVIKLGEQYLDNPKWEKYRSDVILKIAQFYLDKGRVLDFYGLAKNFIEKNPSDKYCAQMVFLMGSTYIKQEDFQGMIGQFQEYAEKYPNVPMTDGLQYWTGMGYFFEQNYEKALHFFNIIVNSYKGSAYYEDALYRKGICLFGLQETEDAREVFEKFIRGYPNSNLRGEAEYFLGDLEASVPNVEKALKHYANVEKYTDNVDFIQNAYFRAGELLEVNKRYDEMAANFEQYINKYRDKGELTGAIYELGRARELQGRPGDMLREYWRAIERFGNNPNAYGLDLIVDEYGSRYYANKKSIDANLAFLEKVSTEGEFRKAMAEDRDVLFTYLYENPNVTEDVRRPFYDRAFRVSLTESVDPIDPLMRKYRSMREQMPIETPEEQFRLGYDAAKDAQERTLSLRLQKALSDMDVDLNPGEVFTEEDFSYGSPITLIWMGKRNSEFDPQLARLAYLRVIQEHPDSESVMDALLALGDLELSQGNYPDAIGYYQSVQDKFPAEPEIVRAVLSQGDAYLKSNQGDLARDTYQKVLDNRDWRGEPHAEALYKIGLSYMDANQLELAQTFFERTYIGYGGFPEWAGAAYLQSGHTLERMGKPQDAIRTYDEFLSQPEYEGTEYFEEIKNARASL